MSVLSSINSTFLTHSQKQREAIVSFSFYILLSTEQVIKRSTMDVQIHRIPSRVVQSFALAIVGFHKIGIRGHASLRLLRHCRRWAFRGFTVSQYWAVINYSDEFLRYRLIPRHPTRLHLARAKKGIALITILVQVFSKKATSNHSVFTVRSNVIAMLFRRNNKLILYDVTSA